MKVQIINRQIAYIIKMLEFSRDTITFDYIDKNHLTSNLTIINKHPTSIYYKFKVNRPRFYLVKPDRGLILGNSSADISIKLHRDGISQANSDKFKCCYIQASQKAKDQDMKGFQDRLDTQKKKLTVRINNLPAGMEISPVFPGSQIKSIVNTGSSFPVSSRMASTSYQNVVREKKDRVVQLKNQIQNIQKSMRDRKIAQGPTSTNTGNSIVPIIIVGITGILLGFLSSAWI